MKNPIEYTITQDDLNRYPELASFCKEGDLVTLHDECDTPYIGGSGK